MTAVWKDAYLGLDKKPERTVAALALGGIGCLGLSGFYLWKEGLLVDGTLNLWVVAVISAELLLVLAAFLYRCFRARREEEA